MKCGNCHKNMIPNKHHAPAASSPRAAAQPIIGGIAPETAPTSVHSALFRFSGV